MNDRPRPRTFASRQPGLLRLLTSTLRPFPDFLILGAQRSGTSSLYRYLSRHPSIRFGRMKEVHFFDLYHGAGERWYRAQFPMRTLTRRRRIGDASPYYLFHPHAASRAARLVPNAALIVILRNPVDRAYSHYHHVLQRGHETLSFEAALDREPRIIPAEEERIVRDPSYRSVVHEWHSYVSRGEYATQIERWLRWFPRERLYVIASESMFADPRPVLEETFSFLGLPSATIEASPPSRRGRYAAPMDPGTRARLVEHFRPHNARLEALLGTRFDWNH